MRILITGASGAMGYYLAEYIAGFGDEHKVYGIGRRFNAGDVLQYLHRYDQLDLYWQPLNRVVEYIGKEAKPDVIFHLAAMANVGQSFSDPRRFAWNNTEATLNLFEAVVRSGIKVRRVVLASTSEVYGDVPPALNPIQETRPFKPVNPYAVTKCCQEAYASYYEAAYGVPFTITRAFGYINPKREDLVATSIARQLVMCELGKSDVVYHGDLTPVRSFCDVRDIAEAYWLAATSCPTGVYNIGVCEPCDIKRLVAILSSLSTAKPEFRQNIGRPTDVFYAVPDTFNFRRVTRWQAKRNLHESLIWLMEEMRKQCTSLSPEEPVISASR